MHFKMASAIYLNLDWYKILSSGNGDLEVVGLIPGWTTSVAQWLEHRPREREIVGSIPSHNRPKSLKLVVVTVAFPLGA